MNKRQLITTAARRSSLTQRQMRVALEAILAVITGALVKDDHVTINGFGRFDTRQYRGRRLRRLDGEGHHTVEDRRIPVFRSSAVLRRQIRRR